MVGKYPNYISFAAHHLLIHPTMRFLSLAALSLLLFLSACTFSSHNIGIEKGNDIPKKEREAVAEIGKKVYDAVLAKDISSIIPFAYSGAKQDMIDYAAKFGKSLPLSTATTTYDVVGEFYALNINMGDNVVYNNRLTSTLHNYEYQLTFPTVGEYGYLYLMELKDKAFNNNSMLLSVILTKQSDEWQIYRMSISPLSIQGKIAPELFDVAKKRLKDSAFVEAYLYAGVGTQLLQPLLIGNSFEFVYVKDYMTIFSDATAALKKDNNPPFIIEYVSTKPILQGLTAVANAQGILCSMVTYKSSLTDSMAIERENLKVNREITKLFPGIDNFSDSVIYVTLDKAGKEYRLRRSVK